MTDRTLTAVYFGIQIFCIVMAFANVLMGIVNLASAHFFSAGVSGSIAAVLIGLIVANEKRRVRLQREDRMFARTLGLNQLEECWRSLMCPDCGHVSLGGYGGGGEVPPDCDGVFCSNAHCGSKFYRNRITKEWTRAERITSLSLRNKLA